MRALGIMVWTAFSLMWLALLGVLLVDMARDAPFLFVALLCAAGTLGYLAHKARQRRLCSPASRASSTR